MGVEGSRGDSNVMGFIIFGVWYVIIKVVNVLCFSLFKGEKGLNEILKCMNFIL